MKFLNNRFLFKLKLCFLKQHSLLVTSNTWRVKITLSDQFILNTLSEIKGFVSAKFHLFQKVWWGSFLILFQIRSYEIHMILNSFNTFHSKFKCKAITLTKNCSGDSKLKYTSHFSLLTHKSAGSCFGLAIDITYVI